MCNPLNKDDLCPFLPNEGKGNEGCSSDTSDIETTTVYDSEFFKEKLKRLEENLSNQEINGLTEEEKLARDVYLTFHALYGTNVFNNIAPSEQAHTDAVLLLINRYDIIDLMEHMSNTLYADLLTVYKHLMLGPDNHLRAYVGKWEQQTGMEYVPVF